MAQLTLAQAEDEGLVPITAGVEFFTVGQFAFVVDVNLVPDHGGLIFAAGSFNDLRERETSCEKGGHGTAKDAYGDRYRDIQSIDT